MGTPHLERQQKLNPLPCQAVPGPEGTSMYISSFPGDRDRTLGIFLPSTQTCKANLISLSSGSLNELCIL